MATFCVASPVSEQFLKCLGIEIFSKFVLQYCSIAQTKMLVSDSVSNECKRAESIDISES
jgi:hypothetical protein